MADAATAEGLRALGAAGVFDAADGVSVLDACIRPLWTPALAAGPAYTVSTAPGDNLAVRRAVEEAPRGSILVVTNGGDVRCAIFGDVLCQIALARGITALVTDGAVRDTDRIRELRFPVFAAGVTPRRPEKRDRGQAGGTIAIADATVSPGDWVVGDGDGVVVVPETAVAAALTRAEELRADEREVVRRAVSAGARIGG